MKKNYHQFHTIGSLTTRQRKNFLSMANKELVLGIIEIIDNLLRGNIKLTPYQRKKLSRHKKVLRGIVDKKKSFKKRKELIVQKGGFLQFLIPAAIGLITSLVGK